LVRLGFEFRASRLQSRCSTSWATPPVHFALAILEMGVSWTIFPRLASNYNLPNLSLPNRIKNVRHQCPALLQDQVLSPPIAPQYLGVTWGSLFELPQAARVRTSILVIRKCSKYF
jgi:hypothetical protein